MKGGKLADDVLWAALRKRAADVLDTRRGSVAWRPDDSDHAFDISSPGLPSARVAFRLDEIVATLGGTDVAIQLGSRTLRRSSYWAGADLGGRTYRIQQRGRRLAELERDGETIAVLARPRRGSRSVNWAMAAVADDEIALGHVLALTAEIGSPGAVANVLSILPI